MKQNDMKTDSTQVSVNSGSTVWILTEEFNEYDQYGDYFICAFRDKPTIKTLKNYFSTEISLGKATLAGATEEEFFEHLLKGGGRQNREYHWFNLEEIGLKENIS